MLEFDDCLRAIDKRVRCRKLQLPDGSFLYSFKDSARAIMEDNAFMDRQRRQKAYDKSSYDDEGAAFGTIVFESDANLSCEAIFKIFDQRGQFEMLFGSCMNSLGSDETRLESDYEARGSEFVDFIATLLTSRIVERMAKAGMLDKETFGDVTDALRGCLRSRKADPTALPEIDDPLWNRLQPCDAKLLQVLGLAAAPAKEASEAANAQTAESEAEDSFSTTSKAPAEAEAPKKRGRPRKRPILVGPPRPRGRPRKIAG